MLCCEAKPASGEGGKKSTQSQFIPLGSQEHLSLRFLSGNTDMRKQWPERIKVSSGHLRSGHLKVCCGFLVA